APTRSAPAPAQPQAQTRAQTQPQTEAQAPALVAPDRVPADIPGPSVDTRSTSEQWSDIAPAGPRAQSEAPPRAAIPQAGASSGSLSEVLRAGSPQMLAASALAIVLAILGWIARIVWKRRTQPVGTMAGPALTAGVRESMAQTRGGAKVQPQEPLHLDLEVEIVRATRSVMMFSLDYRITICNRSERAARDLKLFAELACAESRTRPTNATSGGTPAHQLERVGPHQSRTLSGQLRLPVGEVKTIRQGKTPLFVPLLHTALECAGEVPARHSFVIGTPSASSHGKVHPIPLDAPIGGLTNLKAREIRAEPQAQPA
ncbi:MAG: hypothetical protein AAGE83_02060, partial [Pseudomonadota bacterium]